MRYQNNSTTLDAHLEKISSIFKCAIIVEGNTQNQKIIDTKIASNLKAAMDQVCNEVGYTLIVYKDCYGLQKHYNRIHSEMPLISADEYVNFIKNLEKIVTPFYVNAILPNQMVLELGKNLPPEIIQNSKDKPVKLTELPIAIQNIFNNAIIDTYLGRLSYSFKFLNRLIDSYPIFDLKISNVDERQKILFKFKDGYINEHQSELLESISLFSESTLDKIIKALSIDMKTEILVSKEIKNRPIHLYGKNYTNNDNILRCITQVFGLITQRKLSNITISSNQLVLPKDIRDIHTAINSILPDPLKRYLTVSTQIAFEKSPSTNNQNNSFIPVDESEKKPEIGSFGTKTALIKLRKFSFYHLNKTLVKNKGSLSINENFELEKLCVMIIQSQNFFEAMSPRFRPLDALKYPIDAFYVKFTSVKIDNKPYISAALQTAIPGGQLSTSIGWSIPLTQELQKYYPLPP